MPAVAFHIDTDRCRAGSQEFVPCHSECDQQDVLYPSAKRSRHRTEQLDGGLGIQRNRRVPGVGVGVAGGVDSGKAGGFDITCRQVSDSSTTSALLA